MNNIEFIKFLVPHAQLTQKKFGVYASVTIAQACIESNFGRYTGAVVRKDNNLFGIKYAGVHCPDLIITKGSWATDDGGNYAHYKSFADSVIDHGYFLRNNSRYPKGGVFDAGIPADEQINRIMKCGYAGSSYCVQAIGIMQSYNLYQYDNVTIQNNVLSFVKDEIKNLQIILGGLVVDGIFGNSTLEKCPMLKLGSKGKIVGWVQSYVTKYYQIHLDIDNIYGPKTKQAITKIQKLRGINTDGILGKKTWKAMIK